MLKLYPSTDCCPGFDEFSALAGKARVVPIYREIVADLETPISVFIKLAGKGPGYLLESVEGGDKVARYSFIGVEPFLTIEVRGGRAFVRRSAPADRGRSVSEGIPGTASNRPSGAGSNLSGPEDFDGENPLEVIRRILKDYRAAAVPGLPRFSGGVVGYLGYDLVRLVENLPAPPVDFLGFPDALLMATRIVVIFDHATHRTKVVYNCIPDEVPGEDPETSYQRATAALDRAVEAIRGRAPNAAFRDHASRFPTDDRVPGYATRRVFPHGLDRTSPIASNTSRERFEESVLRAKEYIAAGDIFQVVLSQRFQAGISAHPLDVYRVLRSINPSPYMFYLDFGDLQLAGASPEMLVRLEDGVVETRPIAGTRPRGKTPEEDLKLEIELRNDEKEKAEHVMLVDLGRNDVGRVCRFGTVEVPALMRVDRYSHVMHLVSEVRGELAPGKDALDALMACFPAGTLSGAPKVRAMQIIDELEPERRGPYGGAVGYFGFGGNMDTCITIRTVAMKDGKAFVQTGAGIVADSVPETEFHETLHKAGAMVKALQMAEEGAL